MWISNAAVGGFMKDLIILICLTALVYGSLSLLVYIDDKKKKKVNNDVQKNNLSSKKYS